MSCQELVELVTAYLEGTLDEQLRQDFEAHLALCPGCMTYVDQIRETIALTGELTVDSISDETSEAILGAFRNWRTAR